MKLKRIISVITAMVITSLNYTAGENYFAVEKETAGITVYSLYPTKDSVDGFYMWLDATDIDRALLNDEKNCYWLRTIPDDLNDATIEDLNMWLYKDSNTGATHLAVEDKVVQFIGNDGGLGVTSLALGDLNNDGWNEIYFTYSWNPGTYCSQAGYFDTKTSDVYYFGDYMCPESELIFTAENDVLTVCRAELIQYEDMVHFELEADQNIAEIVCNNGEIEVKPLSDDFIKLEEKLEPTEKPLPDWLPENADEAHIFMEENGKISVGMVDTTTVVKDDMVCSVIYIGSYDSTRSDRICISEKSDIKAPVSYKKYRDEYSGDYIVACFEMPPDSYLEIYDERYYPEILGTYISDENGDVNEVFKGDVNSDGEFNVADVAVFQRWLLGDSFYGGDIKIDNWKVADLCNDGRLDVFDLCLMKQELLKNGQPAKLPTLVEISEMSNEEATELFSKYTFQDIESIWRKFDYYHSGLYGGVWKIGDKKIGFSFDYYTQKLDWVMISPLNELSYEEIQE